jgi:hypothetical protein
VFGVDSPPGLYQKSTDLIGKATQFTAIPSTEPYNASSWSRNGRFIIYKSGPVAPISILPLEGDRKPIAFAVESVGGRAARFSPDGPWIAYNSTETGREEVYVAPFPGRAGKISKVSVKVDAFHDGGVTARNCSTCQAIANSCRLRYTRWTASFSSAHRGRSYLCS